MTDIFRVQMCPSVLFSQLEERRPLLVCGFGLVTGQWRLIGVLCGASQGYTGKPRQLARGITDLIYSFTVPSYVECLVVISYLDVLQSS